MTDDEVMTELRRGQEALREARHAFELAYEGSESEVARCWSSHMVGVVETAPEERLRWNQVSLAAAERATADGDPRAPSLFPTVLANLGYSYLLLARPAEALGWYHQARSRLADTRPEERVPSWEPAIERMVGLITAATAPAQLSNDDLVTVRPASSNDRHWIAELLRRRWASTTVVTRGRTHVADRLPALVAETAGGPCGLATYRIEGDEVELVSLDAEPAGRGTGSALLNAVINTARARGCRRLWLITTNDNLEAIGFYQRRGLRLIAVHPGAVDAARQIKPEIPAFGAEGIPIHDEVEFGLSLT